MPPHNTNQQKRREARGQSAPLFIKINNNGLQLKRRYQLYANAHIQWTRAEISNPDNWGEQMSTLVNTEEEPGENITSVNHKKKKWRCCWVEQSEWFKNARKHLEFSGYLTSGGYCDGEFAFIRRCSRQEHCKCSALQGYIWHQFSCPISAKQLIQDIHTANQGSLHVWEEFLSSTTMFL